MPSKKRVLLAAFVGSVLYFVPIDGFDLLIKHWVGGMTNYFAICLPVTIAYSFIYLKTVPGYLVRWTYGTYLKRASSADVMIEFGGTPGFKIPKGLRLRASSQSRPQERVYIVTEESVVDERGRALIKAREVV